MRPGGEEVENGRGTSVRPARRQAVRGSQPVTPEPVRPVAAEAIGDRVVGLTDAVRRAIEALPDAAAEGGGRGSSLEPGVRTTPDPDGRGAEGVSSTDAAIGFVAAVLRAADRSSAIETLATEMASRTSRSVRIGIGDDSLTRLYDNRLGWVSTSSGLFRDEATAWTRQRMEPSSDRPSPNRSPILPSDANVVRGTNEKGVNHGPPGEAVYLESTRHVRVMMIRCGDAAVIAAVRSAGTTLLDAYLSRPNRWLRRHLPTRPMAVLAVALAAYGLWPVAHPTHATARANPIGVRVLSAPFDATLATATVRPGDAVTAGQTLVTFDTTDLEIELDGLRAKHSEAARDYDSAMGAGDIADAQRHRLRQRQLSAEADLVRQRIERSVLVSPVDGVILSGDPTSRVGSALRIGESIVELSPLDRLRLEIEVDDRDIGMVRIGDGFVVRMDADGPRRDAAIDRLSPQSETREGRNVFVAFADVDAESWRPGMAGKAVVYGPTRPRGWAWVRPGWIAARHWLGW